MNCNWLFINWRQVILAAILVGLNVSLSSGTIIVNPSDTVTVEGATVSIECVFAIPKGATEKCYWTKDGTIISIENFTGIYVWIGDSTKGNCSLRIIGVANSRDDGHWTCQIPASPDYPSDVSRTASLTVYVTPTPPTIYNDQAAIPPGSKLTAKENETSVVQCVSRYGNPAAKLTWKLDETRLDADEDETVSEDDRPRTFKRTIQLQRNFSPNNNWKVLQCIMEHETMTSTSSTYEVLLDIQYSTTTVDVGLPSYIEVDADSTYTFSCKADGNPPAKCEWMMKKDGDKHWIIKSEHCDYRIQSVGENDKGEYMCLAGNGQVIPSQEITLHLRDSNKDISGIIGGIIGGLFLIAIIVLVIVVVILRRKVIKETQELPTRETLDRASKQKLALDRGDTAPDYLEPFPVDNAPSHPPKNVELRHLNSVSFMSNRDSSHIYADPHIYENIPSSKRQSNDDEDIDDGYIEI